MKSTEVSTITLPYSTRFIQVFANLLVKLDFRVFVSLVFFIVICLRLEARYAIFLDCYTASSSLARKKVSECNKLAIFSHLDLQLTNQLN